MRPYHLVPAPLASGLSSPLVNSRPTVDAGTTRLWEPTPNPVTGVSMIRFQLRTSGFVELGLFDVSGRRVREIAAGWWQAGEHRIAWQQATQSGKKLIPGVYFVRLHADGVTRSAKVIIAG